jgi:sugar phosphate isomerase/epimerase
MKLSQVALQLYTLRDFCKAADDLARTLERVRAIGYEAVQASGLGPIPPAEVARLCKDSGLVLCATHEAPDLIRKTPLEAIARLKEYGVKYTAYPFPAGVDFTSLESVDALIDDLQKAGELFAENGCVLTYHNHSHEFIKIGGVTILERIRERTTPAALAFEIDTYWVQHGGGDPVAWCESLPGRLPIIHLKDYKINTDFQPTFAEIGAGNLDFARIIAAAEKCGCQWFIVEQDSCPGDPFDSVKQSFEFIRDHLAERN